MTDQSFDPYHQWLGIPKREQPPHHYRLLSLDLFEEDSNVIDSAANRQMAYVKQCGTGPHSEISQKLLNQLSSARVTLLNTEKKAAYDAKLKAKLQPENPLGSEPAPPIKIEADADQSVVEKSKKKSQKSGAGIAVAVLLGVVIAFGVFQFLKKPAEDVDPAGDQVATNDVEQPVTPSGGNENTKVDEAPVAKTDTTNATDKPNTDTVIAKTDTEPSTTPETPTTKTESEPPKTVEPTTKTETTAVAMASGGKPVDLLKLIDLERDTVKGDFILKNGQLSWERTGGALLQIPADVPSEYEFVVTSTRTSGVGLSIGLLVGGQQVVAIIDHTAGSGLNRVDGKPWNSNETSNPQRGLFQPGKESTIVCSVRKSSVKITFDEKLLIDWEGDPAIFSMDGSVAVPNKQALIIGGNAVHSISKLELRPIGAGETPTIAQQSQKVAGKPVNLLAKIDIERDTVAGKYSLENGKLSWSLPGQKRLQIPTKVPAEYDLVTTLKRTGGSGLVIGFPVGEYQTAAALDYQSVNGLHLLDGRAFSANETTKSDGSLFQGDQETTIVCKIRKSGIEISYNGKPLIDWEGEPSRLSMDRRWAVRDNNTIFIGGDGFYTVSRMELRPVGAASSSSLSAEQLAKREPIPDEAAQKEAEKVIKDLFKEEYASAKKQEQKWELAKKLLQQGISTTDDPVSKYVLLREAQEFAADAGMAETAMSAVEEICREYQADLWEQREEALSESAKYARFPDQNKRLIDVAINLIDDAVAQDRYEEASKFATVAVSSARKARDKALSAKIFKLRSQVTDLKKEFELAQKAAEVLKENPDDPAANFTWGSYLCFQKSDWPAGLPIIAKSDDEKLQAVVEMDLAKPTEPAEQLKLADAWWDWIESSKKKENQRFRVAAHFWYAKAIGSVSGLTKLKVEKRLKEIGEISQPRTEVASAGGDSSSPVSNTLGSSSQEVAKLAGFGYGPWVELFNGKDMSQWVDNPKFWAIEDSELVGSGGRSFLYSKRNDFRDFHVVADCQINDGGRSGIYFRCRPSTSMPPGYEAQINNSGGDAGQTGSLWMGIRYINKVTSTSLKPGDWFKMEVIAVGNRLTVKANGKIVSEYTDPSSKYKGGQIALHLSTNATEVRFRNIKVSELTPQSTSTAKPSIDPTSPRQVVEWVLGLGGTVITTVGSIPTVDRIPQQSFQIVRINLSNKPVTDEGMANLQGSREIRDLRLENVPITDAGLVHLKGMTNLETLLLTGTRISDAGLVNLQGMTNLLTVYLSSTSINGSGFEHFKGMTKLREIRLSNTQINDTGLEHLKGATTMTVLHFSNTSISDAGLEHIKGMTNLVTLVINTTKVSDAGLIHLRGMTNLVTLFLGGNRITGDGLEHLKGMKNLTSLRLESTQLTDPGLLHLKGMTNLTDLRLENTRIGDAGIKHLKELRNLKTFLLSTTQVSDASLVYLKRMNMLTQLFLKGTRCSPNGLASLQKELPNCRITY